MKIMIIQPMRNLSDEEVLETRQKAIQKIESAGNEFVNSYFDDYTESPKKDETPVTILHKSIEYLAKSLNVMSTCDGVYCCKGWEEARGCKIEHEVATQYGLFIMYE